MLEGNAVEGRSQKVNEKAVPAAADVPGTLVEKTLLPAPPTWPTIRERSSAKERTAKISTLGAGAT